MNGPRKSEAAGIARSPAAERDDRLAVEREQHGRQLGRRIGVGDAPAERAAAARGRVADVPQGLAQQRRALRHAAPSAAHPPGASWRRAAARRSRRCPRARRCGPTSTSADGRARRRLSIGTRLCPPASTAPRRRAPRASRPPPRRSRRRGRRRERASRRRESTGTGRRRLGSDRLGAGGDASARESGLQSTWISWAVVGCGAAVLWSCRRDRAHAARGAAPAPAARRRARRRSGSRASPSRAAPTTPPPKRAASPTRSRSRA